MQPNGNPKKPQQLKYGMATLYQTIQGRWNETTDGFDWIWLFTGL